MNKVVLICMTSAATILLFSLFYFTPYFSKKKIRQGRFDLLQFLNLFFAPIFIIPVLYFLNRIIVSSPFQPIIFLPKRTSELVFLLLLYFLILGNGIHSVSVVLSKHMKGLHQHRVWEVNEYFHNAFSHLLITVSAVLILVSYAIMEINHPSAIPLSRGEIVIVFISGAVCGILLAIASIEGSIPKTMFLIIYALSIFLLAVVIQHTLNFKYYPFTIFVETMLSVAVITLTFYRYRTNGFKEIVPQYFFDE